MFFKHAQSDKQLKKYQGSLPGQIFPILVICLAGLAVAVVVTIRTGEGAKSKTYASNSADAGSLTAASYYAGAFNQLVERNKELYPPVIAGNTVSYMNPKTEYQYYKELTDYYDEMRNHYLVIDNEAMNYLVNNYASDKNARFWAQLAYDHIDRANNIISASGTNCTEWGFLSNGKDELVAAAEDLLSAAKCVAAFHIGCAYMKSATNWFKSNQTNNFCLAQYFMNNAYESALQAGLSYAFSNSGTSRLLTQAQSDDFGFWLGSGDFFNAENPNSSTYTWGPEGNKCSITANIELPKIQSYSLKHTKWNFPKKMLLLRVAAPCGVGTGATAFGVDQFTAGLTLPIEEEVRADLFIDGKSNEEYPYDPFNVSASWQLCLDMHVMSAYLSWLAREAESIRIITMTGKSCCDNKGDCCVEANPDYCSTAPDPCCYDFINYRWYCDENECLEEEPCCPDNDCNCIPIYYTDPVEGARSKQLILVERLTCVKTWLYTIINAGSAQTLAKLTIPTLRDWDRVIKDNVWAEAGDTPPIVDCEGAQNYNDNASGWPGMMIINIQSVELGADWTTKCTVTSSCEQGGSTTSTSTSRFDGDGDLGTFQNDYFSEILEVS